MSARQPAQIRRRDAKSRGRRINVRMVSRSAGLYVPQVEMAQVHGEGQQMLTGHQSAPSHREAPSTFSTPRIRCSLSTICEAAQGAVKLLAPVHRAPRAWMKARGRTVEEGKHPPLAMTGALGTREDRGSATHPAGFAAPIAGRTPHRAARGSGRGDRSAGSRRRASRRRCETCEGRGRSRTRGRGWRARRGQRNGSLRRCRPSGENPRPAGARQRLKGDPRGKDETLR